RPITALTLMGGFASTVSWPATHFLLEGLGWRGTYLIYAALLAFVSAPLHALALPRMRHEADVQPQGNTPTPTKVLPPRGLPFVLVASAFAAYAFVPSGLSAHLLAIFHRSGIDAGTVVWIGALFGPAQVGARLIEFTFGRDLHPLWVVRFALSSLLCAFVMFALFGASGYGRLMGRLAAPLLVMQSAAPLVMAFVVARASDPAALALAAGFASIALICFTVIRRPA